MEALKFGWDFFQKEVLGMQWMNRLMGSIVEAVGLDPTSRIGSSIQFFFYDVIKIMVQAASPAMRPMKPQKKLSTSLTCPLN